MQAEEWRNVVLQSIVAHSLGTGVRTMLEWLELLMGSCKVFFLQMQLDFVAHLELVWHPMLIILLLVLGIFKRERRYIVLLGRGAPGVNSNECLT